MYSRVIVASLKGNKDALGLPAAKLIVEGGDRASSWAKSSLHLGELTMLMNTYSLPE
jgi:hypothetical protein